MLKIFPETNIMLSLVVVNATQICPITITQYIKEKVKYPLVSIAANTDYMMPVCGDHVRFHGLEPAVGLHPALWMADYTISTICHYLPNHTAW